MIPKKHLSVATITNGEMCWNCLTYFSGVLDVKYLLFLEAFGPANREQSD